MTPPTRPEPFDPRDADPLTIQPAEADADLRLTGTARMRKATAETEQAFAELDSRLTRFRDQPQRNRGCLGILVALALGLAFWALLFLVFHAAATPRSAPDPTASRPGDPGTIGSVDVSAQAQASASGPELSGAPSGEARCIAYRVDCSGAPIPASARSSYRGSLAWAAAVHGPLYLALPELRGTRAEICGPAACVTRTSTDYGPDQRVYPDRIADVSAADFETVCGMTAAQRILHGRCPGTVLILKRPRIPLPATDTSSIAASGFGMHGAPRLSMSATCRNSGHQAVWVAQTGTAFLDIIQVGTMDGEFFFAYGRGVPLRPDSLYVERHLGASGTGPHRYGIELAARVWTLTVDGRAVATIPDTFRTWHLRATQVMAEGDLPFGDASCSLPAGAWNSGGYGPQPRTEIGATSWRVAL